MLLPKIVKMTMEYKAVGRSMMIVEDITMPCLRMVVDGKVYEQGMDPNDEEWRYVCTEAEFAIKDQLLLFKE